MTEIKTPETKLDERVESEDILPIILRGLRVSLSDLRKSEEPNVAAARKMIVYSFYKLGGDEFRGREGLTKLGELLGLSYVQTFQVLAEARAEFGEDILNIDLRRRALPDALETMAASNGHTLGITTTSANEALRKVSEGNGGEVERILDRVMAIAELRYVDELIKSKEPKAVRARKLAVYAFRRMSELGVRCDNVAIMEVLEIKEREIYGHSAEVMGVMRRDPGGIAPPSNLETFYDALPPIYEALARDDERREAEQVSAPKFTIGDILAEVARQSGVKPSDITGRRRYKSICAPRKAAIYLARALTEHSLVEIGGQLGGRDHTTVLYACEKFIDMPPIKSNSLEENVRLSLQYLKEKKSPA